MIRICVLSRLCCDIIVQYSVIRFCAQSLMCLMSAILYSTLGCRRKVSSVRIEIHLIVPDHLGGVLAKSSENACVGDLATKFVSATSTLSLQDIRTYTVCQKYCITLGFNFKDSLKSLSSIYERTCPSHGHTHSE